MSDALFSGWGIRTMADGRGRATTRSATTSARSGRTTTRSSRGACGATAIAPRPRASRAAILEAAELFNGRLPEAFAGYTAPATHFPVEYPTACSPQAWATGAPLLLLRTLLGLDSDGEPPHRRPGDPGTASARLELLDIPGRWGRIDAFGRGRIDVAMGQSARTKSSRAAGATARRGTETGRRRRTT